MLLSMTGFGKASGEVQNKKITIEVKSLNSKQLDLATRVPSSLRELEIELRNLVANRLERGKADLVVTLESLAGEQSHVKLNTPLLASYKAHIQEVASELGIPEPQDWYSILLRFPDTMVTECGNDVNDDIRTKLFEVATDAIDALMAHRRAEGRKLEDFFEPRIKEIAQLLKEVEPYEAERVPRIRARIEDGLAKIPVAEYDKGRLEQEMIFYIEKLDVNEERQRLSQHLNYFLETMAGEAGQGKKLGFIAQEIGREINTLGSKSNHAEMQRIVVKMKDILEQIKEQVLNVM